MAGYLYDAPPAGPDTRYADAWRNSGAASLVARWVVHRLGDATGLPSTPAGAGVDESAVIELIRVHQEMADAHFAHAAGDAGGNGETPTPATPTPPVVLVDGELYTAYGDITIPGWRGYDFLQLLFTNGTDTFQSEPINTVQLIARSPVVVSMSRNVGWRLTISTTDDNVITLATTGGNTIAAPTATSTMTVIAWFAGTVVGGGGDGTDQTARMAAAAAQADADAAQADITDHETNHPGGGGGLTPEKIFTSSGNVSTGVTFHTAPLDVNTQYQILLKNDRGLTPMVSGAFLNELADNDPVYVRGWTRGSLTSYLEFEVQKNGAQIEFKYYGPTGVVNFQTNLEVWKFS